MPNQVPGTAERLLGKTTIAARRALPKQVQNLFESEVESESNNITINQSAYALQLRSSPMSRMK